MAHQVNSDNSGVSNNGAAQDDLKIDLQIQSLYLQLETDVEIASAFKENNKKLPKDCLDSMRQVAEKLKEDEWFYPSVNKLLGLQ